VAQVAPNQITIKKTWISSINALNYPGPPPKLVALSRAKIFSNAYGYDL